MTTVCSSLAFRPCIWVDVVNQSPSRVVVRYPHHTPLQWAKWQESCQTEENVFSYCLTVSCVTWWSCQWKYDSGYIRSAFQQMNLPVYNGTIFFKLLYWSESYANFNQEGHDGPGSLTWVIFPTNEFYIFVPLVPTCDPQGGVSFDPKGHHVNKIDKGLQGDATYQKSKLYLFQFQRRRILVFFVPMFQLVTPGQGSVLTLKESYE